MAAAETNRDGGADSVVTEGKIRYDRAKDAYAENRRLALEDTQFVMGDSDNKWQWPETISGVRSIENRPMLTVNVTAQHCNQIINNIRQNRPQCKVLPADSKADKKTAEILAGLIRNIQTASYADVAHDTAAEHAIYGGEGYWLLATDYESPTSFNQVIKIKEIQNPQLVFLDPFEPDPFQKGWGFLFEDITKEECKREYPECDPASWKADTQSGWVTDTTVRIAHYYYRVNVPDTLYLLGDGSTILGSEAKKKGALEQVKAMAAAMEAQQGGKASRPTVRTQWKYCKLIGGHDKPVQEKDWPGDYLPIVGVVGKELNVNGKIIRKGEVRDLKDPARMVNYSYSAAIETVALQNKIPYIASAEAIEGYESEWKGANQSNAAVLHYNQFDENGQKIDRPQRQEPAVMPTAQVQMLQLSLEQMRAASGQNNANFGIKSEAASGIGIQRLKVQGDTATFHFPDNLARGLHYEAVALIDLIQKVYTEERVVRILGLDGKEDQAKLDPSMPQAHSEITGADVKQIFNPQVGQYDAVIDTGPSYQTQRQEGAAAMTELASRNPQLMQVAGDIIMETLDIPGADKLAARLKKTLPPELQDDAQQQIPPQAQAAMNQMKQHIQQLGDALAGASEELNKLKSEDWAAYNTALINAYGKETERMKVLGGAMSPEQVQALVMQTLNEIMTSAPLEPEPPLGMQEPQEQNEAPQGAFSLPEEGMGPPQEAMHVADMGGAPEGMPA